MTDQTPDPFEQFHTQECAGNFLTIDGYTQRCDCGLDAALAAERAQHQQEIADETAKRVRLAENWSKERQAANAELAQRDETIRQLRDWQATVTASLGREGGAFYEDVPKHIREMRAQIATLTQERDEARKKCADNERGYESLIRRYEHSVSAETARADAAEARCATLQGAVAADEERLRQAAARAGVLFVGCDTADALADRCATLTAAMERALTFYQTTHIHAVLRAAIDAHQQGVPTP